jgi:hypothetical protein
MLVKPILAKTKLTEEQFEAFDKAMEIYMLK